MSEMLKRIEGFGVVPVVVLNDAKDAAPLAKALCEGGLPCAEVTFRTEAAEESIRIMSEQFPELVREQFLPLSRLTVQWELVLSSSLVPDLTLKL